MLVQHSLQGNSCGAAKGVAPLPSSMLLGCMQCCSLMGDAAEFKAGHWHCGVRNAQNGPMQGSWRCCHVWVFFVWVWVCSSW
jgi:hypothetical protein